MAGQQYDCLMWEVSTSPRWVGPRDFSLTVSSKAPGPSNHNISVDITTQLQASFERSTNMPVPAESFLHSEGAWAEANYASLDPARFIGNTNTYMTVDKHVAPFSESAKVGEYLSLHCP